MVDRPRIRRPRIRRPRIRCTGRVKYCYVTTNVTWLCSRPERSVPRFRGVAASASITSFPSMGDFVDSLSLLSRFRACLLGFVGRWALRVVSCPGLATLPRRLPCLASRKCLGLRRLTAPETACVFCVLFPPPPTACSWLDLSDRRLRERWSCGL